MKKVYNIYELVSTSLESITVSEEYGYGKEALHSFLYRKVDGTSLHYEVRAHLDNGFEDLESAEKFIEKNIKSYECLTVVCEYSKNVEY